MNTQKLNSKLKQHSKWQWFTTVTLSTCKELWQAFAWTSSSSPHSEPVSAAALCVLCKGAGVTCKGPEQGESWAGAWTILSVLSSVLVKSGSAAWWPYLLLVSHLTFHPGPPPACPGTYHRILPFVPLSSDFWDSWSRKIHVQVTWQLIRESLLFP